MQTLGIITYNFPHLKTEQILLELVGKYNIRVYALPFVSRPAREVIFQHRPDQSCAAHPKDLCERFGFSWIPVASDLEIDDSCDLYMITGAGLLSQECIKGKKILNGHPGVIPAARGLDAFKWSIYNQVPLGVTLHYIDENVDVGEIISVVPTPVFYSDTMEILARRHYENEIRMLSRFEIHLECPQNPFKDIEMHPSMRRMKKEIELQLHSKFEYYKEKFAVLN